MKALVAAAVAAGLLSASPAFASEALAKSKNCLACHAVDKKLVGPSYKEIAAKYAGQADAPAMLATKVQKGGVGTWGKVPMPPNAQVNDADAKTLVEWILSLKSHADPGPQPRCPNARRPAFAGLLHCDARRG